MILLISFGLALAPGDRLRVAGVLERIRRRVDVLDRPSDRALSRPQRQPRRAHIVIGSVGSRPAVGSPAHGQGKLTRTVDVLGFDLGKAGLNDGRVAGDFVRVAVLDDVMAAEIDARNALGADGRSRPNPDADQ